MLIYFQKASQSSHFTSKLAEQHDLSALSASKQLCNVHVNHSSDKSSDDLAQKTSKFNSLEQFNFHKEMSVTDHIEILLLEKRTCQNCSQLLSSDNLL